MQSHKFFLRDWFFGCFQSQQEPMFDFIYYAVMMKKQVNPFKLP